MLEMIEIGKRAKAASKQLSTASTGEKNNVLKTIAALLLQNAGKIEKANAIDVSNAKENGITDVMIDRLTLRDKGIEALSAAVEEVIALPDPAGVILGGSLRPNGLRIQKVAVPLGVVAIIYESRPNVSVDAAVLCLKAGNACILRGGKEAINTNIVLAETMREAAAKCGFDPNCVQLVTDTSRQSAVDLMKLRGYVDLLIPRGSASLINAVVENSNVPVIETGVGNCHVYVDETADLEMAADIVFNAKTSRPSVCNAAETLLVDKNIAEEFLPAVKRRLDEKNVRLFGCPDAIRILGDSVCPATQDDWANEYLDYALAVRVVEDIGEAIEHIDRYSSLHSEAIVTKSLANANLFTSRVDAAAVYVNASTRFTDGGEFGLGAELGISTQKLHARGPMGLEVLATYKYVVSGSGQIR